MPIGIILLSVIVGLVLIMCRMANELLANKKLIDEVKSQNEFLKKQVGNAFGVRTIGDIVESRCTPKEDIGAFLGVSHSAGYGKIKIGEQVIDVYVGDLVNLGTEDNRTLKITLIENKLKLDKRR